MAAINFNFLYNDVECIKLECNKYLCLIAPLLGARPIRLFDKENNTDIFRFKADTDNAFLKANAETWGLPTMYLANRFDRGVLKTSAKTYQLPINEPLLDNFIHGWVHKREFKTEEHYSDTQKASVTLSYIFDENDEMYTYFPNDFKIKYVFTLDDSNGFEQEIIFENKSEYPVPAVFATHTSINADKDEEFLKLYVPIGKRCLLDERCLPNEKFAVPDDKDKEYLMGKNPVLQSIDNEMYFAESLNINGKEFYGTIVKNTRTGVKIYNEVSKEFKFWNIWNEWGNKGYFCPEPMTAMINSCNLSLSPDISGYCEIKPHETYKCSQRFFTEKSV